MSTADQLRQEETELRELRRLALQSDPSPEIPQILEETQQRLTEIRELLRPQVCQMIDFSNIPAELQKCNQWVLWKNVTRDGKETKMPFTINGKPASSTDPATWSTFAGAVEAYDPKKYSGIGFVFSPSDDFCGIDLDGCRDPQTGTIADWAVDEILRFSSYTEISPSGTGVKIWVAVDTQLAKGRKKELRVHEIVPKSPAVEIYSQGRYFATTGHVHKNYRHIEHRENELQEFLRHHWPAAPAVNAPAHDWRSDDAVVERCRKYVARMPGAVSGSGGHNQTFTVACRVVKGFALSKDQAFQVLSEWNASCVPPWSDRELQHKIESAAKAPGPTGYLRDAKPERWDSIAIPRYATGSEQSAVNLTGILSPFLEGDRVRCGDRGNLGTVQQDDGGPNVLIHFQAKDGNVAEKWIPRSQVQSADGSRTGGTAESKALVFHDAWRAAFNPKPLREVIIEGMARRGEVANFIASTKTGKSWFSLLLLFCIALGRDWLGRRVARGNVLLIDNELHEETIENRISAVRYALQIKPDAEHSQFDYLSCRGDWLSLQDLIEGIPAKYAAGSLNLIVIDAKYRLFGNGLEENSNDDQTKFHNMIDTFAKRMNCPVVLVHHSTKGDQAGKAVTDLGSGGGSQSRAVDLHMTIRPHQQPGHAVLEGAVRSFAPIEPITLRWNWPLWSVAEDVEPALQADKSRSDSRQEAKDAAGVDELRKILEETDSPLSRNALHKAFGGGKERLNRLIRIGVDKGVFEAAGTKTAQNGEVAELFTLARKKDSNVQRSVSTV